MNRIEFIRTTITLSATVLLAATNAGAQTWETVLDYQSVAGSNSGAANGIAADSLGNVFCGGFAGYNVSGTNSHGLVLKTDTTQMASADPADVTWYLSDDDTNPDPTHYRSSLESVGVDAAGNAYSIGQLWPLASSSGEAYWYVRKSSDQGLSWSTLHEPNGSLYQYTPGQWVYPTGFAADGSGNIYVVGAGRGLTVVGSGKGAKTQSNVHWLVRRSADAGQTWTLVDNIILGQTYPDAAAFVPGVGVFVVGEHFQGLWVVRRSITGDAGTWSTVDVPITNAAAHGVCGDGQGNVYVVGERFQPTGTSKRQTTGYYAWTTRKSSDGGNTWSTVETFTLASNAYSQARAVGTDASGHTVVVGKASDAQGKSHWITRMLGGSGWETIDDFQLAPGYHSGATAVTTDATGNLLVVGTASDAMGSHWIVRRLPASTP